ncbi:hypothetical protein BD770DRAFT_392735 [Pilaira anomala]|nr:hypothetical protein BD770DRAFT_392735 [Pilaira anomala]
MNNSSQYKIVQVRLRELLYQRCSCRGPVIPVIGYKNYKTGRMYCVRCKEIVGELLFNYKFVMTVFDILETIVEDVTFYDEVGESFIGCSPKELIQYIENDDNFLNKLEELAEGLYIEVKTEKRYTSKKAKEIKFVSQDNLTLIDLFKRHQ